MLIITRHKHDSGDNDSRPHAPERWPRQRWKRSGSRGPAGVMVLADAACGNDIFSTWILLWWSHWPRWTRHPSPDVNILSCRVRATYSRYGIRWYTQSN